MNKFVVQSALDAWEDAQKAQPQRDDRAIKELLGAYEEDLFFATASGEDATHQLMLAHYFNTVRESGRNHILTTSIEDHSAIDPLELLGCAKKVLPLNEKGLLTKDVLEENIRARSSLLSISWGSPLTGVIQPLFDIATLCKERDVLLHVDISAVYGKLSFRFQDLPIDFITFDGNAIHGPIGSGGLLVSKEHSLKIRDNSAMLPSLATALETTALQFDHICMETARLKAHFEKGVKALIPDARILFEEVERLPNITAISFPGAHAESLRYRIKQGELIPRDHTSLSFAFTYKTTQEEIDALLDELAPAVCHLREVSHGIV